MFCTSALAIALLCAGNALPDTPTRLAVQANTFTRSTQDAVSLGSSAEGATVLTWQSRRQQEGTYGVYARSFGPDGAALSAEVQLNVTTESHQMHPVVALDESGCAWFAWRSVGQDGSLGTIVARRFDPRLTSATAEVIVNDVAAGNQRCPTIVALPGGGALVAWLDPGEGTMASVRARRLAADGSLAGEAFDVSAVRADHRTPTAAVDAAGRVSIAYARVDRAGAPAGLFLRTLADGELSAELRLDEAADVHAIEPALAATDGGLLAGWLEAEGDGYGLRARAIQEGVPGPVRELATGEGWVSGLALALDGAGNALATWNRHADGEKREAGLHARRLEASSARPTGEPFRVTSRTEGGQAIAVATPGAKCALFEDGRMAFAWQGDGGGEDTSAVHLTLIAPAGVRLAAAAPLEDAPRFGSTAEGAARPTHDPPTFDPRTIERDRSEDQQGPAGGGIFDFLGFTSTGWNPPDPEMGVGPDHIVVMVNGGIAWFLKDGTKQFEQDINGSGGFWGSVGASGFVYDPEVVYDIHSQRFFVFASDGNQGHLLAVSDDSDPNGSWNKFLILTSPIFGAANVDSGNLAVDEDFVTITGDIFSPDRLTMMFIDKASAISGGPLVQTNTVISGRQSMGTCTNQDPGSHPLYLTWAEEFTTSTSIRIYAVTNRATSPTVQFTTLTVPQYSHPNDPPQQGTSSRPELFEARFWSSMIINGRLWAVHHEGSDRTRVQWYEIDLGGWPGGGSPTLLQSGEVDLGSGVYTFFPSIWADAAGNAAITFNRSSSSEFISIQMVTRRASDPPGQMSAPIEMRHGASPDSSGRFGDYSATNSDPAMPGSFWGHHEYRGQGAWRTRIGRIDVDVACGIQYCDSNANQNGDISIDSCLLDGAGNVITVSDCGATLFAYLNVADGNAVIPDPPGSSGDLCLGGGGPIGRYVHDIQAPGGSSTYSTDIYHGTTGAGAGNLPNPPGGVLQSGDTWYFQGWQRMPAGQPTSWSAALEVTFS